MPEQLHALDIAHLAHEHTDRNPVAPSHIVHPIAAALQRAFEEDAHNVSGTVVNALAGEEVTEVETVPTLQTTDRLRLLLDDAEASREQQFGAAVLLAIMALSYNPSATQTSTDIWHRKRDALTTTAHETVQKAQHHQQFGAFFSAVVQKNVQVTKSPDTSTENIAFDLMDAHFLCLPEAHSEQEPIHRRMPQKLLHFAERESPLVDETTIKDNIANLPWLQEQPEINNSENQLEVRDLVDGQTRIATVINLIPYNDRVKEILDESSLSPDKLYGKLASAILKDLSATPSRGLSAINDNGITLKYSKNAGPSIRCVRIYFTRLGTESGTPVYGLVGASRTKKLQADLLSVFQGRRVGVHDID